MSDPAGTPWPDVVAELEARGFEPTERYTSTGRIWRKKGIAKPPVPSVNVPHPVDGRYPDFMLDDLRKRIYRVNDWLRPHLASSRDEDS